MGKLVKNLSNLILGCLENYNKYQNIMNIILFFISIIAI